MSVRIEYNSEIDWLCIGHDYPDFRPFEGMVILGPPHPMHCIQLVLEEERGRVTGVLFKEPVRAIKALDLTMPNPCPLGFFLEAVENQGWFGRIPSHLIAEAEQTWDVARELLNALAEECPHLPENVQTQLEKALGQGFVDFDPSIHLPRGPHY